LEKLARAVEGCHRCNIVHCDIKPDNFLYSQTGDLWLCDFDSAMIAKEQCEPLLYGTTSYWAPEVCNEEEGANDFPRDMWALGITIIQTIYCPTFAFSSTPDPDYIGGNMDRACAEAVSNSIDEFMAEKQVGDFPWPKLLPSNYTLFSQDHKHLQALLSGLLTLDPNKRMTAKRAVDMIVQASTVHITAQKNDLF